ncbi:Ribonucleoside-diphosphate reductase large subunit, partial [Chytriomyces hyalinus]
ATEPINSIVYKRQTLSGEFQIINHHLVHSLLELGLWNEGIKQRIIEDRGSVQNIAEIPADVKALISQKVVIDHAANRAMYIDQAQSMNLFLADPTYKKIMSLHFYAFDRGVKTGMYYLKMKPPSAPLQVTVSNNNNVTIAPIKKTDETAVSGADGESCTRDCLSCSS